MSCRFKICGVRSARDVEAAVDAGAAAIGFNFYPKSPRCLTLEQAIELASHVPLWVDKVALFVNEPLEYVEQVAARIGAGSVQLHGDYSPEECGALTRFRVIYSIPTVTGETAERVLLFSDYIDALLLDASVPGEHGGTGETADWDEAAAVRSTFADLPVILAGGLNPDNVAAAIRSVRPFAVDTASGVESAPGIKEAGLIMAFADAVTRTHG